MVQVEGAEDAGMGGAPGRAEPGALRGTDDVVRLTVPSEADFVAVVRLTVQAVAARAGCTDDARSRLRAAAGAAFFELAAEAGPSGSVVVELRTEGERVGVDLTAVPPGGAAPGAVGRSVHVDCELPPPAAG